MPEPEIARPSNKELWWTIYPYVNKRLYEYLLETVFDFASNSKLKTDKYENPLDEFNNGFIHLNDFENYVTIAKNYINVRYNIDYRNLDAEAPYYSPIVVNQNFKKEVADYKTRVLFYFNPEHILNGIEDENLRDLNSMSYMKLNDLLDFGVSI